MANTENTRSPAGDRGNAPMDHERARATRAPAGGSEPTERKPIDANELERMARARPDDCFLKGSGDPKHPLMLGYDTKLQPWEAA